MKTLRAIPFFIAIVATVGVVAATSQIARADQERRFRAMAPLAQGTNVETYDLSDPLQSIHIQFDPLNLGSCITLFTESIGWESGPACYNGRAASGVQYNNGPQAGGPSVSYYLRDTGVYLNAIYVTSNGGPGEAQHIRLILDNGDFLESAPQETNQLYLPVGYFIHSLKIAVLSDSGFDSTLVRQITLAYQRSAPATATITFTPTNPPTATTGPSPTPLPPTDTPPPGSTAVPSSTPRPTSTPTRFPTLKSLPLATIKSIDNCPINLATPCGTPFTFLLPILATISLPSPTLIALLPTFPPDPITATPTITNTPGYPTSVGATPTPTTYVPPIDSGPIQQLSDQLGNGISTLTPLTNFQVNLQGTPTGLDALVADMGRRIGTAINFARGLELTEFNKPGGIISFLIIVIVLTLIVEIGLLVLPFIIWLARLILQTISSLKPF